MGILTKSNKLLALLVVIFIPLLSQPATASSHASSLKNLDMNEIMFAQGMIPHHQQAIDMSNMALKNGASAEVKKLAKGIISAQQKEMSQLKYWLTATKSSMTMDHDMGMNGMIPQSELDKLSQVQDAAFDKLFLAAMILHHEGAIKMTSSILDSSNPDIKQLAENITKIQTSEIAEMKALLEIL